MTEEMPLVLIYEQVCINSKMCSHNTTTKYTSVVVMEINHLGSRGLEPLGAGLDEAKSDPKLV